MTLNKLFTIIGKVCIGSVLGLIYIFGAFLILDGIFNNNLIEFALGLFVAYFCLRIAIQ